MGEIDGFRGNNLEPRTVAQPKSGFDCIGQSFQFVREGITGNSIEEIIYPSDFLIATFKLHEIILRAKVIIQPFQCERNRHDK